MKEKGTLSAIAAYLVTNNYDSSVVYNNKLYFLLMHLWFDRIQLGLASGSISAMLSMFITVLVPAGTRGMLFSQP